MAYASQVNFKRKGKIRMLHGVHLHFTQSASDRRVLQSYKLIWESFAVCLHLDKKSLLSGFRLTFSVKKWMVHYFQYNEGEDEITTQQKWRSVFTPARRI